MASSSNAIGATTSTGGQEATDSVVPERMILPPTASTTTAPISTSTTTMGAQLAVDFPTLKPSKRSARNLGNSNTNSASTNTASHTTPSRLRVYKSNSTNKWVTREIAALEFLLGIPMEAERDIVHQGWLQQQGLTDNKVNTQPMRENEDESKTELLEPPNAGNNALEPASANNNNNNNNNNSHHARWWEKWINNPSASKSAADLSRRSGVEEGELEQPPEIIEKAAITPLGRNAHPTVVPVVHAPGRRLEGDEAVRVQIPLTGDTTVITRQRFVARMAVTREWELKVAHGIGGDTNSATTASNSNINNKRANSRHSGSSNHVHPPLLDGRLFFSAAGSYPHQVFSLLRYEPKKEEAARRRQKLEARGGGGTQFFIMPIRDWRGISYRALLPPRHHNTSLKSVDPGGILFDRFASTNSRGKEAPKDGDQNVARDSEAVTSDEDDDDADSVEEEGADTYVAGLLDDPEMVQGRHRTVMVGDRVTGCIVSSTIQFVKPELLKADLNKQFRERFDGWEPPQSQRKYIGARVIDGLYTLLDPSTAAGEDGTVETGDDESHQQTIATAASSTTPRNRQASTASISTAGDATETIRMPPSLTLSKIRSVKRQALLAAVKAKLEISTVALAIVYFERLCLDCRVDKTNRRLSFAACLLLAIKINEAHVGLVMTKTDEALSSKTSTTSRIQSLIRPTKKSSTMFATLLEFFTQDWNISLKHLFAAEWGVFAALQFRLHAKPSQVAFHFKRLMKSLDWNPRRYLGAEMYDYWQDALAAEEYLHQERENRREMLKQKKEQKRLMRLQRELEAANRREEDDNSNRVDDDNDVDATRGTRGGRNKTKPQNLNKLRDLGSAQTAGMTSPRRTNRQGSRIGGILNRLGGGKRAMSTDKLSAENHRSTHSDDGAPGLTLSPSMPEIVNSFPQQDYNNDCIIDIDYARPSQSDCESGNQSEEGGIIV